MSLIKTDAEAVKILNKIRACRYDEKCKMKCENCPCNYSDEELHEAIARATQALKERRKDDEMLLQEL